MEKIGLINCKFHGIVNIQNLADEYEIRVNKPRHINV
jgi:hypothetical protein